MKIRVMDAPVLTVGEDTTIVTFNVELPREMFKNRMLHEFNVHIVRQKDYKDQLCVASVSFTGNKRDRQIRRENRRNGIEPDLQWSRKYRRQKNQPQFFEFSVRTDTREWMYEPVYIYVKQTHSRSRKEEPDIFPFVRYKPDRR